MALISCPDCNKQISDKATSCPNCGFPIKAKLEELNLDLKKKPDIEEQQLTDFLTENSIQVKNTKAKIQSYFPHIVLIGLIISIFIYSMQFNSSKENDSVEKIVISNSQPINETLKFHINSIEDISVENKKRWIYRVLILTLL